MRTVVVAVVFAIVGAVAGAGVMAWEPWEDEGMEHTLTGTVLLRQQVSIAHRIGDTCLGEEGYSVFRQGTQVLVTDGTGALLETGALDKGTVKLAFGVVRNVLGTVEVPAREHCEFSFEIPEVPDADFYSIEIGTMEPLTLSRRELETKAWTLQVELGY